MRRAVGGKIHCVQRCIEEDVFVRIQLVGDDCVEGGVSGSHNCDGTFDDGVVDNLGEVISLTEGLQSCVEVRPQCVTLGFKVDEEDEGLFRIGIEHTVQLLMLWLRYKLWIRVLAVEYTE